MATTEKLALYSVERIYSASAINVAWQRQIVLEDTGEVLYTIPELHRQAFGKYQRDEFLAACPGYESDADAAGLEPAANAPVPEPVTE